MADNPKVSLSDSMNPLYDISVQKGTSTFDSKVDTNNVKNGSAILLNDQQRKNTKQEECDSPENIAGTVGSVTVGEMTCPRVNCPEKIVICLDNSHEMIKPTFQSRTGDIFAPMMLIKRALGIFLHSKHRLNPEHEFALVWLKEAAYWICDFTSDPERILTMINNCCDTFESETCEFSSVFEAIQQHITLPNVDDPDVTPPPYVLRTLLIYGRSHCIPHALNWEAFRLLNTSMYFFVDAYYIHEAISEENNCEEIYNWLCNLDEKETSYIFEVSRNPTRLYDCMAQLLAHPLQRPLQVKLNHSIQSKEELTP